MTDKKNDEEEKGTTGEAADAGGEAAKPEDEQPAEDRTEPVVVAAEQAAEETEEGEEAVDWGAVDDEVDGDGVPFQTPDYDPGKDQDLHMLAMQFLGIIAIVGIVMGGVLWAMKDAVPDYLGVVVGSAVTAIAALFSKK